MTTGFCEKGALSVMVAEKRAVTVQVSTMEREMDDADRTLVEMGYQPAFKRSFTMWSCFSFALSISGLYATIMATFSYPLYAGGAAAVVWCWLIAGAGALALALSVAEISSAYPTSGGMYFTLKFLSPPEYVAVASWINGWLNLVGTIAGTASTEYGAARLVLSCVSIGTSFSYQATEAHTIAVMAFLCILHAAINSLSTAWLSRISNIYAAFHIAVLVAAAVALLAVRGAGGQRHSATYVFTNLEPENGWSPPGFSFFFGSLSVAWIMANCDGVGHIAEETKDPSRVIPSAIVMAALFTYVVGFLYNIVLAFNMGDPKSLLNSPTGVAVAQLFYDALGRVPALFFMIMGVVVMTFVCIPSIHAGSRTLWAFSRDEMVPLSRFWRRLDERTGTPLLAVWLYAGLCIAINLIGLGSPILATAVFNVCAIALNWSYCVPILFKLRHGRFRRGPWHMGRYSAAVNVIACAWNAFLSVFFVLPTILPVTASNMNYAGAVLLFALVVSVAYWYAAGRRFYTGPRTDHECAPQTVGGNVETSGKVSTVAV